jgi:excisionase family DNA binding protein
MKGKTDMSGQVKAPEWLGIKEAAEYLRIGEPTLYRWMRDGKITYRKVGDSTRFLEEDLASAVQVVRSKKDSAAVKAVCPACHCDDVVPGVFKSTGLNYFVPDKGKFWTLRDHNIKTTAMICARCGHVSIFGDTAKLDKIRKTRPADKESGVNADQI